MASKVLGLIMMWLGVGLACLWLFILATSATATHPSIVPVLLFLGLIFGGRKLQGKPLIPSPRGSAELPVPGDFKSAYAHDNIAIDTTTNRIWLRDGQRARVFEKKEILGWQAASNTVKAPDMYGGGVINRGNAAKYNSRLLVQTNDLDHPVYSIRFTRHNALLNGESNYNDAVAWGNRLTAYVAS